MDLLAQNFEKLEKSFRVMQDSLKRLPRLEATLLNDSRAMEPYDALASRFERFVEIALNKYFRSVELHHFAKASETLRDRLHVMEKLGLVSSAELWMEMRDFRNRIAHDYLPEQLTAIYNGIQDRFAAEMEVCFERSKSMMSNRGATTHVSS